jgi:hypothetical protein
MKNLTKALALVSLPLTVSCSPRQPPQLAVTEGQAPRLIGCAETRPRVSYPVVSSMSIELRYDVDTEGKVTALRVAPNPNATQASDAEIAAAKSIALSCVYEPALRDGQPVVSTVTRWFTVDRAGGSGR